MLVFRHPKYYEEMRRRAKKFQKEQADKQASEQAALNVIPVIDCEGRCFAVVGYKTGDRGAFV